MSGRRKISGLYVPLEHSVLTNPKITKLARRLRISRPTAIGHLAVLWASLLHESPNGVVPDGETIEILAQWDGDDGRFVSECVACGLVDEVDDGFEVHKYYNRTQVLHQARQKERERELTRERVRKHRQRKALSQDSCNAKTVTETHVTYKEKEKENTAAVVANLAAPDQQNLSRNIVALIRAAPEGWPEPTALEIAELSKLDDLPADYWAYVLAYTVPRATLAPWAYAVQKALDPMQRSRWDLSRDWPTAVTRAEPAADTRRQRFEALGERYRLGPPGNALDELISLDEVEAVDSTLAEYAKGGGSWAGYVASEQSRRRRADEAALAEASARGLFVPVLQGKTL